MPSCFIPVFQVTGNNFKVIVSQQFQPQMVIDCVPSNSCCELQAASMFSLVPRLHSALSSREVSMRREYTRYSRTSCSCHCSCPVYCLKPRLSVFWYESKDQHKIRGGKIVFRFSSALCHFTCSVSVAFSSFVAILKNFFTTMRVENQDEKILTESRLRVNTPEE